MTEPRKTYAANTQGGRDKSHFDLNPDQPIAPNARGARGGRNAAVGRRATREICVLLKSPGSSTNALMESAGLIA